jgi:hypothetical protein
MLVNVTTKVYWPGLLLSVVSAVAQTGPTFSINEKQISSPLSFIVYGDQRFTDPQNTTSASPTMRQLLVKQIAREQPAAVILNGDVPNAGHAKNDYAVYLSETKAWRDAGLLVIPALGNHEMHGVETACLENWWSTFPQLRNRRWYSTQIGSRLYVIALDSTSSLLAGTQQAKWLDEQMSGLDPTVDFVVLTLHHPPVADIQTRYQIDHNPRPNEIALRDYLAQKQRKIHARILVSAGHIHNYERQQRDGITYLVTGGGGAKPYLIDRTPEDLYQGMEFPNFHYVKFVLQGNVLKGTMYRAADPNNPNSPFEAKDSFEQTVIVR